jgi:hypothetical protein
MRRRLQGLFGRSFQLEVRSEIGEGTTVTMRIPLRKRFGVGLESPRAIPSELCELASTKICSHAIFFSFAGMKLRNKTQKSIAAFAAAPAETVKDESQPKISG